ncbi:MAG: 30S ribosome-binding factor RbfA [Moraxellaceae bacterium]|nr:30S ribosome-binding factor RbfA [Moraxellaceae bacterium]
MSQRTQRIADQIQRDLSDMIRLGLKDPRLGMVTISSVKVSSDMGYADVYVTVLGATLEEKPDASLAVLNGAAGFLRSELGRALKLRMIPRLRFHFDEVTARGNRMAALINTAVSEDRERASARGDDADA